MDGYRVSELADRTGFSPATLRYYEQIGLLERPARSPSGYRLYGPSAEARLRFIARAKRLGLSLDEIKNLVKIWSGREGPKTKEHLRHVVAHKMAEVGSEVEELATFLRQLEALYDHLARGASRDETEDELPDLPHVTRLEVNRELKLIESSQCTCGGDCGLGGCTCGCSCCGDAVKSQEVG